MPEHVLSHPTKLPLPSRGLLQLLIVVLQSFVQRDFDGTMTNYPVGPETTTGKLILSVQEKFLDSMLLLLMI